MLASDELHTRCPEVPRARHLWTIRVFAYSAYLALADLAYLPYLANFALAYLCVLLTNSTRNVQRCLARGTSGHCVFLANLALA